MSDPPLPDSDGLTIAAAIRGGAVSAVKVTEAALARIAARDSRFNSFTAVTADRALADARAVDAAIARGDDPGPLAGVPFAVKNLFDVAGLVTVAGSKIDRERPPAPADATVVGRLARAGAILVGALNMDEYAYGFTTENTHYGPAHNPHDPTRIAGGSSGGSGVAVAEGLVPLALGSDTNGSIRVPASLCGIFGLKPTYGRLSRAGARLFAASLDHVGPLARSVGDLAAAYDAMQGPDPLDPACAGRAVDPAVPDIERGAEGLRIALARGYFAGDGPAAAAVASVAKALGVTRTIEITEAARARAAAFVITASEGANLHFADLKTRAGDFDPMTRDRFLAGALIPANWVVQAQRFRAWYREQLLALFDQTDILLMPATPCGAPLIGQDTIEIDGAAVPMRPYLGVYTQPLSFIGLPIVAVPLRPAGGLPIGVQIVAAPWRESDALRVARALERDGITSAGVAHG
ncbi:MAG TPA: AtzE family amidohydrolase [Stellaceae bacterium]|jgi:AtzE family amidohydrolase|nr:AtzE family amidohydrolase [Stellaceae bacterium]